MSGLVETDENGNPFYTDLSKIKHAKFLEQLKCQISNFLYDIDQAIGAEYYCVDVR